ncbi:MAG: FtsQ-type POTRA domain-containing protein [Clostridia bacterium]|nr:FtsQ-type POTRA domain-containing protein [Clostridia bacterium]
MKNKKKKQVEQKKAQKNQKVAEQNSATQNKKRVYTREEIIQKKKKIKNFAKWTILILILIAIGIFLCTSSIFKIQEINISGNEQIMQEEIQINNRIGRNIFLLSKGRIERDLKKIPYVKKVTIKKRLPNKLEIKIEERQKAYMIQSENGYLYLDNQGYILEESSINIAKPILIGTASQELVPGKRLEENDLKKLEDVIKIVENCKKIKIYDIITNINISDDEEYIIYIEEKRKFIYIGDSSNLANKMLYIEDILEKEEGKEGKIFVNGNFSEGFQAYFREEANQ